MSHRHRILIVDDDRDFGSAVVARLKAFGMDAVTATNPLAALAIVSVARPDIICLDIEMPTGNGLTVREILAGDPSTQNIPVVILTGRDDPGTIFHCSQIRAAHVHKSPKMWRDLRLVFIDLLGQYIEPFETAPA